MGNVATSHYISSPAESYKDLEAWETLYQTLPKVYWFNNALAKHVSELVPGEMVGVLGRTGNGKTSLLLAQAYHQAKQLLAQRKELENVVVYFTWDQPKEMLEKRLRRAMQADGPYGLIPRMELPLWFVGKGIMDGRENGDHRKPLTVDGIERTLDEIMGKDKKQKPSLLLVDYLQRVPGRNNDDKMNAVMRVSNLLSDFASDYNVPTIVGSQVTRDTDKQTDKTPTLGSSRWSAEFEDMVDKLLALWRPETTEKPNMAIDVAGKPYTTDEKLMKVTKWKDREGMANQSFAFPFDMTTLKAGDYE
jgi:replicative DNA helicase